MTKAINLLQEWSIPLIAGVFVALIVANTDSPLYHRLVDTPIPELMGIEMGGGHDAAAPHAVEAVAPDAAATAHAAEAAGAEHGGGGGHDWGHYLTLHFLINDIFMVFFFGIAAKEIVESILPGGSLNPPAKAINPLLGTIGGVVGPVVVYLILNALIGEPGVDSKATPVVEGWAGGWGIPTATDIALAWLVARMVFGARHPAVSFLLLLAVADDAIGLFIIAFFYPSQQPEWLWTLLIVPGVIAAYAMRQSSIKSWVPYVVIGGTFSWCGLYFAHLHPALALVPIVPFLPWPKRDVGMFEESADYNEDDAPGHAAHEHSTLENFEHGLKLPVDFGLFFFAFANAGVEFSSMSNLTWIVFLSLLIGKLCGITGFSTIAAKLGAPLPTGMGLKQLFVAAMVAGIGLTVALFVCGQAFPLGSADQAAAKMGALFSGGICILAVIAGAVLGVREKPAAAKGAAQPQA